MLRLETAVEDVRISAYYRLTVLERGLMTLWAVGFSNMKTKLSTTRRLRDMGMNDDMHRAINISLGDLQML